MRLRSRSNGMQCPPPGRASASQPASSRGFHLSGDFKAHCNDVVSVAERISRLFSRKQIYHVHRNHKSMSMMSLNQDQPVYSINNNDFLTKDQELEYKKIDLNPKLGYKLEVNPLSIRHGSEPFLNKLPPEKRKFAHLLPESNKRWSIDPVCRSLYNDNMHIEENEDLKLSPEPNKRWSLGPSIRNETNALSKEILDDSTLSVLSDRLKMSPGIEAKQRQGSIISDNVFIGSEEERRGSIEKSPSVTPSLRKTALSNFSRDSSRCSVQLLDDSPNKARWADAADRLMIGKSPKQTLQDMPHWSPLKEGTSFTSFSIVLPKKQEQLGIHVIQSTDARTGQDQGLLIEEIEIDGRIAKDPRIQLHDVIVNVNSQSLIGISFERAKEIFSNAMQESELRLHIIRNKSVPPDDSLNFGKEYTMFEDESSTPKKVSSFNMKSNIQQGNTRKIGKRVTVSLIKGPHGLGFSITTRDNHLGGEALVYIKSILTKGSAIEDGNLRVGDRLLEINDIEVTGQTQADIVRILRQIPQEGIVVLTLSRQGADESTNENMLPLNLPSTENNSNSDFIQRMPSDKSPEDSLTFPWKPRKMYSFRIPVHNTEKDGLGIKVKGKTITKVDGCKDLGIFVKSIIEGGAASMDGHLEINDQMININGMSLLEKSNSEAMKMLYTTMNQNLKQEIFLTIARRFDDCDKSSVNTSGITSSEIGSPSSPVLTSTPNHAINKEISHKLSEKVVRLENFVDSEISNVSCDKTIIFDDQINSDFEEQNVNDCPGASFRSISDTTIISEDSKLSQASLEKSELGFSRDEIWRQSMSEKRPATLDGKNTDTLQRNKRAREEKERQRALLVQENILNDDNELQCLSPKRSSSINEEDLSKRFCFNSSNEHNKPFFLNSTEQSVERNNKKSVIFNSLGSIFRLNKNNHRNTEKQEKNIDSHRGTQKFDMNFYRQDETGALY